MLGTVLKLLRPRYALTALILFAGWQGYSFIKSIPEQLHLPQRVGRVEIEEHLVQTETEQATTQQRPSNRVISAMQGIHPGMRILYWLIIYVLLCFASVPLIKRILVHESNLINAGLIIVYSLVGFIMAFVFAAFQLTWIISIILLAAIVLSACIIIRLASELEKLRVQDSWS